MPLLGLSETLLATTATAVIGLLGAVVAYAYYERTLDERDEAFQSFLANVEYLDQGRLVSFDPPDVSTGLWGLFSLWRHLARQKRMAKKGYVKWYRLDSTLDRPTWVKPTQEGAGVPKVTVSGQPYYFPKDSMVSDSRTGAYVAMHREGEANPINLRDPAYPGIETDLIERLINLEAEDKPPGLFDNLLGLDDQTLMWVLIGVLFVLYAGYRYLGGGL